MPKNDVAVKWKWESDTKGLMKDYDVKSLDIVEAAYQGANGQGKSTVTLHFPATWTYEFDWTKMTQTNLSTKRVRKISREDGKRQRYADAEDSDLDGEDVAAAGVKKAAKVENQNQNQQQKPRSTGVAAAAAAKEASGAAAAEGGYGYGAGKKNKNKLIIKGRGAVSVFSGCQETHHVYESGKFVYQATLNQVDISNNNNKFYVVQALEADDANYKGNKFILYAAWGRQGNDNPADKTEPFQTKEQVIKAFERRFKEKTKNDWSTVGANPDKFVKHDGKYQMMAIDLGQTVENQDAVEKVQKKETRPIQLPKETQDVMKMISNTDLMEQAMRELEVDTEKMPLGMIAKTQIKQAFECLKNIEKELKKNNPDKSELLRQSSAFYTLIPTTTKKRFEKPATIDSENLLETKKELLENLSNLEIASKLLAGGNKATEDGEDEGEDGKIPHPMDRLYGDMKCKLTPISHDSEEFQRVVKYIATTKGKTHNTFVPTVQEVFAVDRQGEAARYEAFKALGNRQLLWHGSRTTNFLSLLSRGYIVAGKGTEAVVTGKMFGEAFYATEISSKSLNYCHTNKQNPVGFALLTECALGKQAKRTQADPGLNLGYLKKNGYDSVLGIGKSQTEEKTWEKDNDDVIWPMGPIVEDPQKQTGLLYDEMMVYDTNQFKMRYLVQVHFKFN